MSKTTENQAINFDLSLFEAEVFISVGERIKHHLANHNNYVQHAEDLGVTPEELDEGYRLLDEVRKTEEDNEVAR